MNTKNPYNSLAFKYFIILWAFSILFFQGFTNQWVSTVPNTILTVLAILTVLKPRVWPFLGLILTQLVSIYLQLPHVPNILMFSFFVDFTIIGAVIIEVFSKKSLSLNEENIYRNFAPVIRIEIILLYCFAFFHKLNYDFFIIESSCVSFLTNEIRDILFFLPSDNWFIYSLITGTLIIEGGIPLLLTFRNTRLWGICLGLIFHFFLARSHYDFSAVIFALYSLFIPRSFIIDIYGKVNAISNRFFPWVRRIFQNIYFIAIIVSLFLISVSYLKYMDSYRIFLIVWCLWAVPYLFIHALVLLEQKFRIPYKTMLFHCPSKILLLVPLLVLLNGFSPYLGLKTENSFSMYSNLRTEGGNTNHMIIPKPLLFTDYQTDLVYVLSSTDKDFKELAKRPNPITYYEFKKLILQKLNFGTYNISLNFRRKGKEVSICNLKELDIEPDSIPYYLKKFLVFRPIQVDGCVTCVH